MNKSSLYYAALVCLIGLILASSCRRIQPESGSAPTTPLPAAKSQINVGLEIPLDYLEKTINGRLNNLLYTENGLDIGDGLFADLDINKSGRLTLESGERGNLLVSLPVLLKGKLKLEKKIFGQMVSTAIPFEEPVSPKISFKPVLKPDWSFAIENLEIESWGRELKIDLLGYQIDFEPMVKKRILQLIQDQLDNGVMAGLNFKSMVQNSWEAFGKPIRLNTGMADNYLYTIPQSLKIQNEFTEDQKLLLNIGIEGEVQTRPTLENEVTVAELPDLTTGQVEGNFLDLTLPIAITYTQIDEYLNGELTGKPYKLDSKTTLIPHAFATGNYGDKAMVKMEFTAKRQDKKDVKGEIYLVGKPYYDPEKQAILFSGLDFDLQTQNFYANSANWLKKRKILKALQKKAIYPIGDYLEEAQEEVRQMGVWEASFANMTLQDPVLSVEGIYPSEDDIRIYLKTKGDIGVTWQPNREQDSSK